jgi:hypothetical protein
MAINNRLIAVYAVLVFACVVAAKIELVGQQKSCDGRSRS